MRIKICVKNKNYWFISLIICLISICILFRYAQELEVANDLFIAESFSSNDQMIITIAELDRIVFRFTLSQPWQTRDDMYLDLQCINSGVKHKLNFTSNSTYPERYYYHYVSFTTVIDHQSHDKISSLKPGKYVVSIGFDHQKKDEEVKGKLVIDFFCKYKRFWHYKFHDHIYFRCEHIKKYGSSRL